MGVGKPNLIILKSKEDWEDWYREAKYYCVYNAIWEYVGDELQEGTVRPELTEPTLQEVRKQLKKDLEKEKEEFDYKLLSLEFDSQSRRYRTKYEAIANFRQWILDTNKDRFDFIKTFDQTHEMFAEIKKTMKPRASDSKIDAINRYTRAAKTPKNKDIEKWVTEFRVAYDCLKRIKKDTDEQMTTFDFVRAIEPLYPLWADRMGEYVSEDPTKYNLLFVTEDFRRYKDRKGNRQDIDVGLISGGREVAFATFKGRSDTEDSSTKKKGRPHCICGKYHYFDRCWYVVESSRPDGWKEDLEIAKKFSEAIEKGGFIAELIKRAKRKREDAGNDLNKKQAMSQSGLKDQKSAAVMSTQLEATFTTQEIDLGRRSRTTFILDCASDTHLCIDKDRFIELEPSNNELLVGDTIC